MFHNLQAVGSAVADCDRQRPNVNLNIERYKAQLTLRLHYLGLVDLLYTTCATNREPASNSQRLGALEVTDVDMCNCGQVQYENGLWYWAEYSTFSLADEAGKYRLSVAGYSGDAGDAMAASYRVNFRSNGRKFSTPDSDNDDWGER